MKKYILLLIIVALAACQDSSVFEDYKTLDNEEWCLRNDAVFEIDIPATGNYNIDLCLRHTTDYEMANLWCFMNLKDSTGIILTDTVNIKVAENDGRWLGQGHSVKALQSPINKKNIHLDQGKYTLTIEQGMRTKCLKGVKNVGVIINPAQIGK